MPGQVPQPVWSTVLAAQLRGKYPQLDLDQVDRYVASKTFDVFDVSSGLQEDQTYIGWGTDRNTAQQLAWREIQRRGWAEHVAVQSRKALADAGGYAGSPSQAAADLRTYVDLPSRGGAVGVDIWAWAQHYKGATFALLNRDLRPNPLWSGLFARRKGGGVLFTNFTPSLTLRGVSADLTRLATVFTDVFIATGTG